MSGQTKHNNDLFIFLFCEKLRYYLTSIYTIIEKIIFCDETQQKDIYEPIVPLNCNYTGSIFHISKKVHGQKQTEILDQSEFSFRL